jgi:hypothetical protein
MPLDAELWAAIDHLDFDGVQLPGPGNGRPYHFAVLFNPHDRPNRPYITVMHKSTTRPEDCEPPHPARITPGDDALEVIGALTDRLGDISIDALAQLVDQVYPEYDAICGTLGDIFTDTATRGTAASVGMGIPLGQVQRAVELALRVNDEYAVAGLLACGTSKLQTPRSPLLGTATIPVFWNSMGRSLSARAPISTAYGVNSTPPVSRTRFTGARCIT